MTENSETKADAVEGRKKGRVRRLFRLPSRRLTVVLTVVGLVLLLGVVGVSWASLNYGNSYDGKILPGANIAGEDVGGMTRAEAVSAVRGAIGPQLDRTITLRSGDKTWDVTPRELGAHSDARRIVGAALDASDEASFMKMVRMRIFGDDFDFERDVAITYPKQGIRGFVKGIASSYDRDAREAAIDYSTGWVELEKARDGRKVVKKETRAALLAALRDGDDEVDVDVRPIKATGDPHRFDKVLLVRIGENKLYLYEKGKITHEWPVAPGQPQYPTPTGEFEIELKRYMPTWVNPAPDTWGANLPESIPPGISNPLGLRALNWSAPAIRFHGTTATYSLGYNASHGCVRMSNTDVIQLYDLVDVGTPIVSIQVAPFRPLYSAPSIVDRETTQESGDDEEKQPDDANKKDDKGKGKG